jgi:hypothetical protein
LRCRSRRRRFHILLGHTTGASLVPLDMLMRKPCGANRLHASGCVEVEIAQTKLSSRAKSRDLAVRLVTHRGPSISLRCARDDTRVFDPCAPGKLDSALGEMRSIAVFRKSSGKIVEF